MNVKSFLFSSALLATFGAGASLAVEPLVSARLTDSRLETMAPTVTSASCSVSCDDGCGANWGGGCGGSCDAATSACDDWYGAGGGCCDGAGSSGCDSFGCGCDSGLLGYGLIKSSDHAFDDFISPMTNPVFFEDPRTLTEARFIFLNHQLPTALGSNSVQAYAMQVRVALTKRLSLIATKDGFVYTQSPVLDSGFLDVAAGLKYNLYRDAQRGRLLSVGGTFEVPTGSKRSLQGNGNGEFHFFTTAGTRLGSRAHLLVASGIREPADKSLENGMVYFSGHLDRQIGNRPLYAFTELNWYNYTSSGTAFPLPIEGGDIFNLGSPGITGNDLVTNAVGLKAKPRQNMEAGVAWEYPLTARQGLMDNRLTADFIVRY